MTVATRSESRVRVHCCDCGSPMILTERQSRRREQPHRCAICLAIQRHQEEPVEDRHRRYWLDRFSDEEIARMASELLGEDVSVERVRERWNRSLLCV